MLSGLHPAQHIPPALAPLSPASHPLRRVLVVDGKMLCMPSPPTLQTSAGDVRCRPHRRPGIYVSVESWGRSSLMGGGSLFPPGAFRLLPFRRNALQRFSLAPAAHARPNALTLIPPGFVLPVVALAPPRFSSARASLFPSLSLACGARFARPYANAFPPPCGLRCAPPTPRKPACGEYEKGGRRG